MAAGEPPPAPASSAASTSAVSAISGSAVVCGQHSAARLAIVAFWAVWARHTLSKVAATMITKVEEPGLVCLPTGTSDHVAPLLTDGNPIVARRAANQAVY